MSKRIKGIRAAAVTAGATGVLFAPVTTLAAPGTLSDAPLFLTNPVEPNVLFLLDDSGSMDWGLMTPEDSGIVNLGCAYYYAQPAPDNNEFWVVPTEEALRDQGVAAPYGGVWRAWNPIYNKVYYDPRTTYAPWAGENSKGVLFGNVSPLAAPYNPDDPDLGTLDLTATTTYDTDYCDGLLDSLTVNDFYPARYYAWTDSDGDGVVDADDEHTLVEISPATLVYSGGPNRQDCAAAPVCTYAEEIQNFANWFSYYRKREYVAKAAYGQVIAGASNARMGMATLHNNESVNEEIDSMNEDPRTGAKKVLLRSLYTMQAGGGTPLRSALDDAGKYLSCRNNAYFGSCPALPSASGGACQQNFSILMTDGFYNGNFAGLGNTDGDNNTKWDSDSAGPFGDSETNTLADIAMEYYENDIQPGLDNKLVPPPGGIDDNESQHMVTYSVGFGVQGTLTAMPPNTVDPFTWPAPATDPERIDDLRHAAWNGRGDFYSAQDPGDLIGGLRGALRSIQSRIGSAASVAFNTGSLSTNSEVYLALFNSERWSGNLLSFDLDPASGAVRTTPNWSAAHRMNARDLSTKPRTLLSYDGTEGIALQWSKLTTEQQNDFRTSPSGGIDNEATGMARLGYIRGDRGCEFSSAETCSYNDGVDTFDTKAFRQRNGRLGDIVHSGPVFVGAPESNWPDVPPFPHDVGQTYTEFKKASASRPGVVYVGGNDGILHGFAQANGHEVIGYVPNALFSTSVTDGMHYLSDPAYAHRYGVDARASIADAYVETRGTASPSWRTILVGGLRAGGRGMFGLDVTDPTAFSESGTAPAETVLWEFTSVDDPDLGYTFSRPSIVPLEGPGNTIRWAAVFGNGYNDLGSGEATLFILFIEDGLDGTWSAGSDYIEISTGAGDVTDRNGLATPAVIDTDGDRVADRVYAGDLVGNMWAFDLSGSNAGNWGVAHKSGSNPVPLFTANSNQQITSTPVIVRNTEIPTSAGNAPNTIVIFGTGQYLTAGDVTTTDLQAMYGIWDSGSAELDESNLERQDIGLGSTSEGVVGRTLTDNYVDYTSKHGWYMELPDSGERIITDPVIRGELVFFNTMIPDSDPCNFGGTGWMMVAKWINGGNPVQVAFDINRDGRLDDLDEIDDVSAVGTDLTGIATSPVNLANKRYTSTTETTGASTIDVTDIIDIGGPNTGRLSWEELIQ